MDNERKEGQSMSEALREAIAELDAAIDVERARQGMGPIAALRYHVSGAIERGEATAVVEITRDDDGMGPEGSPVSPAPTFPADVENVMGETYTGTERGDA